MRAALVVVLLLEAAAIAGAQGVVLPPGQAAFGDRATLVTQQGTVSIGDPEQVFGSWVGDNLPPSDRAAFTMAVYVDSHDPESRMLLRDLEQHAALKAISAWCKTTIIDRSATPAQEARALSAMLRDSDVPAILIASHPDHPVFGKNGKGGWQYVFQRAGYGGDAGYLARSILAALQKTYTEHGVQGPCNPNDPNCPYRPYSPPQPEVPYQPSQPNDWNVPPLPRLDGADASLDPVQWAIGQAKLLPWWVWAILAVVIYARFFRKTAPAAMPPATPVVVQPTPAAPIAAAQPATPSAVVPAAPAATAAKSAALLLAALLLLGGCRDCCTAAEVSGTAIPGGELIGDKTEKAAATPATTPGESTERFVPDARPHQPDDSLPGAWRYPPVPSECEWMRTVVRDEVRRAIDPVRVEGLLLDSLNSQEVTISNVVNGVSAEVQAMIKRALWCLYAAVGLLLLNTYMLYQIRKGAAT